MKLIDNQFDGFREIKGFSREELLNIKKEIEKCIEEDAYEDDLREVLQNTFPQKIIDMYSNYLVNVNELIQSFNHENRIGLFSVNNRLYHLNSVLLQELFQIASNLSNLSLNLQNTKRFLKKSGYLQEYLSKVNHAKEQVAFIQKNLKYLVDKEPPQYKNTSYAFFEIHTLINSIFILKELPDYYLLWEEFSNLKDYIQVHGKILKSKGILSKKAAEYQFHFILLKDYINSSDQELNAIRRELLFLLFTKNLLLEYRERSEVNIDEQESNRNMLQSFLQTIFKPLIIDELGEYIEELRKLEKKYELITKDEREYNLNELLEKEIRNLLPNLVEYYLQEIENDYKLKSSENKKISDLQNTIDEYSEKITHFHETINTIGNAFSEYKKLLISHHNVIDVYLKISASVLENIERRREEFVFYLETIKDEWIKEELRTFIDEEEHQLQRVLAEYRDQFAEVFNQEFSQFEPLQNTLKHYQSTIRQIKARVYQKFNEFKDKNIDQIHLIKKWESFFSRIKQQASYLFTQYIKHLIKYFGGIIEKEDDLLKNLSEITTKDLSDQNLPLNYAVSGYLHGKLSQKEIKERIMVIKEKISYLKTQQTLYESEMSKLEEILGEKIKLQEGVQSTNVQCSICHKNINLTKDKHIKCSFCGAFFHYLCIAFWLDEYNSCPACQNAFLDPSSNLYEFSQ